VLLLPFFVSYHTEIRPLLQVILTDLTSDGQRHQTSLVDCTATLDFVSEDFVKRVGLLMRKSATKTHVRLANGQRVTSTIVCDISFAVAQHDFVRTFHVLRDLRAADIVLGLPWLINKQVTLRFDAE
jgi:hypothetical protein